MSDPIYSQYFKELRKDTNVQSTRFTVTWTDYNLGKTEIKGISWSIPKNPYCERWTVKASKYDSIHEICALCKLSTISEKYQFLECLSVCLNIYVVQESLPFQIGKKKPYTCSKISIAVLYSDLFTLKTKLSN